MAKPALGRGLGALLGGSSAGSASKTPSPTATIHAPNAPAAAGERVERIALSRIQPCPFQPRKDFSPESLRELADSIQEQGIVQPLIVRPRNGAYELIAGERRWRAAQLIQLKDVPAVIREADDKTVLELAPIENLQRENLNPLEEALGYSELTGKFRLTQEEVAKRVGKSRAVVANALRLLKLPAVVQESIRLSKISVGHAKVLAGLEDPARQVELSEAVIQQEWSVRQLEEALNGKAHSKVATTASGKNPAPPRDIHVADLENRLQQRFGSKVSLRYKGGKGSLEVKFFSDDDLERILEIIGVEIN